MPLYDFECTECGATAEAMVSLKDVEAGPTVRRYCQKCGTKDGKFTMVRKEISKISPMPIPGGTPKFYTK